MPKLHPLRNSFSVPTIGQSHRPQHHLYVPSITLRLPFAPVTGLISPPRRRTLFLSDFHRLLHRPSALTVTSPLPLAPLHGPLLYHAVLHWFRWSSIAYFIDPLPSRSLRNFCWHRSVGPSIATPYGIVSVGHPSPFATLFRPRNHSVASVGDSP